VSQQARLETLSIRDRVWFGLLGPLLVRDGETPVAVPTGRLRVLLAVLLVHAGRPVPADALAEVVWDGAPPSGALVTLRSHVLRLRRVLGPRAGARLATRYPGYLLQAAEDEFDLLQFRCLCRQAGAAMRAGVWAHAERVLDEALGLWRGAPFADVPCEALKLDEAPGLAELHLQAQEWQMQARLRLGRHAEVVGELRQLTGAYPLRERLHGMLMLALYRTGRQAEALAAYQNVRQVLVDQLGAEPGSELQRLHHRMLAGNAAEADPPATPAPGAAVPRQLPAAVSHFTGRAAELAALTRLLDQGGAGGPGTVVIGGTAGVGKTALAVHWAHRVAGRFGDGQLYVSLRGFDASGTPATAAGAIRGLLDALGVPPGQIPPGLEAQAGLYRSLLADRRMLILLDNARDEQQVRPLLPGSPSSLVLVTSRSQLGGLGATEGAWLISLDVLTHAEAVQLLAARLGTARAAAESAAVSRIANLCACLPLALAVAAARSAARPGFPLAALAAELADSAGRLDALDVGDPGSSVRAVFSWSTRQLTSEAARMFRLLGIHPGPDISVSAAASLAALAEADARRLLRELGRAHLIAEHVPGRYAFHDLLHAYAAEQARHTDSDSDWREATGRVLDHYLHTAAGAGRLLAPAGEPVVLALPRPGTGAGRPADHGQALAWYEAEHQVLLAAIALAAGSGFDTHAWQLAWAISPFLQARGHWQEWGATQRIALDAATRLGDAAAQAISGRLLAKACTELGDHDQARGHYASSLRLYQRLSNRLGEAKIQHGLGLAAERQGRHVEALGHAEQALRLYQAIGDKANEAEALNSVGWHYGLLGDYQQARAFCRQALTLSTEAGNRWIEGPAWDSVGYAEHHLGNLAEAAACYQRALSLHRRSGDRFSEAGTLTHLGDTRHATGQLARARQAWQQALAILEDLQHPDAGQARAKLASTNDHASSNPSA
jgi:DNA-binding SARP family transcriptional activator/tetratricopeptide (TPR) repeat protein